MLPFRRFLTLPHLPQQTKPVVYQIKSSGMMSVNYHRFMVMMGHDEKLTTFDFTVFNTFDKKSESLFLTGNDYMLTIDYDDTHYYRTWLSSFMIETLKMTKNKPPVIFRQLLCPDSDINEKMIKEQDWKKSFKSNNDPWYYLQL
jgi:hypothetical protein